MKLLLALAALLALAGSARADGCPPISCGTTGSGSPGSRYVALRPNGQSGPLVLYDVVAREPRLRLPAGILSADGRGFIVARVRGDSTVLTRYSLPAARPARVETLPGRYVLAGGGWSRGRAVLTDAQPRAGSTNFSFLDTERLRVSRTIHLRGSFGVEALSPDGRRLFLVRYGRGGYNLRVYDTVTQRLSPTPLAEGQAATDKMVGTAWTALRSRDGRWLHTLYVRSGGGAFVHLLDLQRGVGHCIDVPAKGGSPVIGASALVLSPDESRLYVANPLLGFVSTVDVRRPHVMRTTRFRTPLRQSTFSYGIGPNGASAPDGRTIAFSGSKLVWSYDTETGRSRGPFRAGVLVAGLAFASNGRVVALGTGGSMRTVGS